MHEIIESYLKTTPIAQQQIDSYNRFISVGIQKIIDSQSTIEPDVPNFAIKFSNIRLERPIVVESDGSTKKIMPNEALARNLTYAAPIYITYIPIISGIEKAGAGGEAYIGDLPVMVKSDLCYTKQMSRDQLMSEHEDPSDPGGYFIIRGVERALVALEDNAPNKMITTKSKDGATTKVYSQSFDFRSICSVSRDKYGLYSIYIQSFNKEIDLVLLLKALGIERKEMLNLMNDKDAKNDMLFNIEMSKHKDIEQKEALAELGRLIVPYQTAKYQIERANARLDTLLPHIGNTKEVRVEKAQYIVRMIEKTSLVAYRHAKPDDRDHYANKRLKLAGDLLEELFTKAFRDFSRDVKYRIERTTTRGRRLSVKTNISPEKLTQGIISSMNTGTWPNGQTGVSQVLDRVNLMSSIDHLRRVKSSFSKKRAPSTARDVHGTHLGKLCPSETPEGQEVGLTRALALMAKVTIGADRELLTNKLKELKLIK